MAIRAPRTQPGQPAGLLVRRGRDALCLLLLCALAWVLLLLARRLAIVVVPCGIALLFTALLRPAVNRLQRAGLSRGAATSLVVLVFWSICGALAYALALRATAQAPRLVDEATATINDLRRGLARGPLAVTDAQINSLSDQAIAYLQDHRGALTTQALTGFRVLLDFATGAVLAVFVGLYLIYNGTAIWRWLMRYVVPTAQRERVDVVGHAAYYALSGYLRGQLIVAVFHGTVIGIVLLVLHVPLALPLAVLVALGSFIPLVGALIAGGAAVLVTLVTHGPLLAAIVVGVLVVENQVEAHLLQPFVVGHSVAVHPLAIALGLTTGAVLAGVWGAVFVVPLLAALNAGWKAVRQEKPSVGAPVAPPPSPDDDHPPDRGRGRRRRVAELADPRRDQGDPDGGGQREGEGPGP